MIEIRYAEPRDQDFWLRLDRHLPPDGFAQKARDRQGYILLRDGQAVGLMRYNLFWDSIPFCNLLFIEEGCRRQGYGKMLMARWEADMMETGFGMAMVSTQADETAQHFYRKIGYRDCGGFTLDAQPMEIILAKTLRRMEIT